MKESFDPWPRPGARDRPDRTGGQLCGVDVVVMVEDFSLGWEECGAAGAGATACLAVGVSRDSGMEDMGMALAAEAAAACRFSC